MYQVTQVARQPIHCKTLADAMDTLLLQDIHYSPEIQCDGETLVEVDYRAVPGGGFRSEGFIGKTREAVLYLKLAYARKIVSGKIDEACWNTVLEIHHSANEATVGVIVRLDRKVATDAFVRASLLRAGN